MLFENCMIENVDILGKAIKHEATCKQLWIPYFRKDNV